MPAPFPESLLPVVENYESIKQAFIACKLHSYHSAIHSILPDVVLGRADVVTTKDAILIGKEGSAKTVLPITPRSPKELFLLYKDIVLTYDGVYDVPTPYATAAKSVRFKAPARPNGQVDFVIETSRITKLPRISGATARPLVLGDKSLIEDIEQQWALGQPNKKRIPRFTKRAASTYFEYSREYWDLFGVRGVVVFVGGAPVAIALGGLVHDSLWSCGYRYWDTKYPEAEDMAWAELAALYPSVADCLELGDLTANTALHKKKASMSKEVTVQYVLRRKRWEET